MWYYMECVLVLKVRLKGHLDKSKYFEYLCRSDFVTLPHIGGSEVLLAT